MKAIRVSSSTVLCDTHVYRYTCDGLLLHKVQPRDLCVDRRVYHQESRVSAFSHKTQGTVGFARTNTSPPANATIMYKFLG